MSASEGTLVRKFFLDQGVQYQYVRVLCESEAQGREFLMRVYPRAKVVGCPIACDQTDPDFNAVPVKIGEATIPNIDTATPEQIVRAVEPMLKAMAEKAWAMHPNNPRNRREGGAL